MLFFSVVNENVSLVISRQLLSDFCSHLTKLPDALAKDVAHFTLDKVHTRVISFEEQVSIMYCSTIIGLLLQCIWFCPVTLQPLTYEFCLSNFTHCHTCRAILKILQYSLFTLTYMYENLRKLFCLLHEKIQFHQES